MGLVTTLGQPRLQQLPRRNEEEGGGLWAGGEEFTACVVPIATMQAQRRLGQRWQKDAMTGHRERSETFNGDPSKILLHPGEAVSPFAKATCSME